MKVIESKLIYIIIIPQKPVKDPPPLNIIKIILNYHEPSGY